MAKNITVLAGGSSAERAISQTSGQAMAQALVDLGFAVTIVDPALDLAAFVAQLDPKPDIVVNGLHGCPGEDGVYQAILDYMNIPYTHSGMQASALAMDKVVSRQLFAHAGLPIARGIACSAAQVHQRDLMARPYVIKPAGEGSSVGIEIFRQHHNAMPNMKDWAFGTVLVEEYIAGHELTVSVMDGKALGVTELRPKHGFYNYEHKYTAGLTEHIFPANIPQSLADRLCDIAQQAHGVLGCRSVTRADFRVDGAHSSDPHIALLEINTQPGMTPLSLVPEQARGIGMGFSDLVAWIVARACHD